MLKNNRGYTLPETMIVVLVMVVLIYGTVAVWLGALKLFQATSVQSYTDVDANIAMQNIVSDIHQAELYTLQNGNTRLVLTFPTVTANGWYDRGTPDPANTVTYYLSDATGNMANTGKYLWRNATKGVNRYIRKDVSSLTFATDNTTASTTASSLRVSLQTSTYSYLRTKTTTYQAIAAFLRNN